MFNWIKGKHKTPCCENLQSGWQSKDIKVGKYWIDNYLEKVDIEDISEGSIHNICKKCNKFVEVKIRGGKIYVS